MSAPVDPNRRNFLKGRISASARVPLRPPWALPEPHFLETCSRCNACIDACPEKILVRGAGGYPELDFSHRECTFCRACTHACASSALSDAGVGPPWNYIAHIDGACLGAHGVFCRSCGEVCAQGAIHFTLSSHGVPLPQVGAEDCSGCGACVGVCPTQAVAIVHG